MMSPTANFAVSKVKQLKPKAQKARTRVLIGACGDEQRERRARPGFIWAEPALPAGRDEPPGFPALYPAGRKLS